jgi:broad specificity phosphatase PhoE
MELIIVRHGETEWTISGQYTGVTDISLTPNGRRQAISLRPLLDCVLSGRTPVVYSSPRERAAETAELALPAARAVIEPLISEYDYGDYEGLTPDQISVLRPGWDIWRDGCPGGESPGDVGSRAGKFLREHAENSPAPLVVVSHAHFSRILAARALGLAAEAGHLFASATASVAVVRDYHGERCIGLWDASADLVTDVIARAQLSTPPPAP